MAAATPVVPASEPREQRLPLGVKLGYGAPSLAGAALGIPIALHMPQFYSDVVLVPLGYVALAIAIARAFDAITDPLMGWLTDRTRSRYGRRKPWIALGVPLCALLFFALFSPPEWLSTGQATLWFGFAFGFYFLFHTIYEVPHGALGAELTLDYDERSRLFGIRTVFVQIGVISAGMAPAVLVDGLGLSARASFSSMAAVTAVLLVVLYSILLWRVPERPEFVARASNPLVPGVRRALRNRPFRILFLSALINAVPAAIPAVLLKYFTFYVVRPENPETTMALFLGIYIVTGTLCVPIMIWIANRFEKLYAFVAASIVGVFGSAMFFFVDEGEVMFTAFIFFVVGIQSAAQVFLTPAMGADTIDYDELHTGKRREAQFQSFWSIIPKFVAIPGSSVPIAILAYVGYVPNVPQTPEVVFTIKFLFSLFPIAFYLTALAILLRYPISHAVHRRIREGIAAHERGESAIDPLTEAPLLPPTRRAVAEETGWFLDHFSIGELRRALASENRTLVRDVLRIAGFAAVLAIGSAWLAMASFSGADQRPGPVAVLAVVAAGLALTAFLFHSVRLGAALRQTRDPVPPDIIRAHLEA